ncbi:MAG: nucleoside/nucleotide kinase family protein [Planctomycetota bacterium]
MPTAAPIVLTEDALTAQARRLLAQANGSPRRVILGIAGIAGSGKSTLGERLMSVLNRADLGGPGAAVFIPMDGFHLPNATLIERGWKPRKGAAFTYDAEAYVGLLQKYTHMPRTGVYPVYCRKVHEPVQSEVQVTTATRVIVTEGQYLLLPETPWSALGDVLDECWWLDVPPSQARGWLMRRDTSVGRSPEEAETKYQRNDRLNTEHVLAGRREPDLIVRWPDRGENGG